MRPRLRSSSPLVFALARGPLAAVLLTTAQAWAQPATGEQSAADVTMARQLGNKGLELAQSGDCAAAVDPLSRSEAMHHAPTTLTILGECNIRLGKLVEGAEQLTRVVRENLDPLGPRSFQVAQERARTRLEETRPRIPKVRLVVRGAAPNAALTLRFDGDSIPVASLGLDRPVDPGAHHVEVSAHGYTTAAGDLTVREGETRELSLELAPLAEPESQLSTATPEGTESSPGKASKALAMGSRQPHNRVPAYVAVGIGGAGIAAGAAFGLVTLSKTSSLDKRCPTRSTCPASAQSDIDLSKMTAWTSTIAFGVGAAVLLPGLYFALRGEASGPPPGDVASHPTLRPWFGLGSGGIDGSF